MSEPKTLAEPSLYYSPPYRRPLEDDFAWNLVKYLRPIAGLRYRVKVETPAENENVDFVVHYGDSGNSVGFQIGPLEVGYESNDEDDQRLRDALVIGSGVATVLYRFRAGDLLYRPHDALYIASQWDPALFSERGRSNLYTLASHEAKDYRVRPHHTVAKVIYEPQDWLIDVPTELIVRRLSRANPSGWMRAYDEALAHFSAPDTL